MNTTQPSMTHLFEQLGLPSEVEAIAAFIGQHRPLQEGMRLVDAPFWTPAQAHFIDEKLKADDDWAVVIDSLNTSLRDAH